MKYIDYGTMQSDAQRRVLEMQRRARNAVYFPDAYTERTEAEPIYPETCAPCSECDVFSDTDNDDRAEQHCSNHADAADSCICKESRSGDILGRIAKDPEEALLLAILVLLISEKADMLLILALVYLLI